MMQAGHSGGGRMGFNRPPADAPERPVKRDTLWRTFALYRPYRRRLAGVIGSVLINAGLGVVPPLLVATIIDDVIPSGDTQKLLTIVGVMLGVTAVSGLFNLLQAHLNTRVGLSVMRDLRGRLYSHLQRQPVSFFAGTRTGEIQSRLTNDVTNTQLVLTDTISTIVSNAAIVIASVIAMAIISWQLSLVALGVTPIFVFFTVKVGRRRRRLTREAQQAVAELTASAGETLSVSGVMLAKTFGREREQLDRFDATNEELTRVSVRQQMTGRGFFVLVQTFFGMAPAIVWFVGGWLLFNNSGGISVGDIVAFTAIQTRLLFPLAGLLNRGVDVTSALALFERIFEYLDLEPEIKDPADPVPVDRTSITGEVAFSHVGFKYDAARGVEDSFGLEDVTFTAAAGKLTALVGPSGSGKTTMGYLMSRLYDVDEGGVSIDNIDLRDMTQRDLSTLVSVVSQDPFLFHASIGDNLRYGDPSASEEDLAVAARAAQIYDTIDGLPEGFDTIVGERGYRLSGGERQRVAIARAVLANPRVLLLDEATSSLDTQSERLVQRALGELMEGRTTVAIAHRLSTIIAADQILVVLNGRIVDRGNFTELVSRSGLFRQLYEEQFTAIPTDLPPLERDGAASHSRPDRVPEPAD
ncbi:MAG: ABC transporter ATP-binding protein [Chloroflexi bacterium]|jgi:ATP-binding cassette, subfamily B, bacterial|nr:ABC transporter ATP-binding protein [Chloroflexota bacterium]MBT4073577.1 ABC transporter ATP-binding protein [Chloroflexota bacterium]MBT4515002.1 ABC transporter ATP-binding protein [Chloroflexota bacterium]MBT5318373.1 ABC transporter ATP-binding protein [Chloroflexota bacterium]MBT6682849.1 ABC transporter ATP-binding protein [Chloroflexota bacterium]